MTGKINNISFFASFLSKKVVDLPRGQTKSGPGANYQLSGTGRKGGNYQLSSTIFSGTSTNQLTGGTGAVGVSNDQQQTGNAGGNYQLSGTGGTGGTYQLPSTPSSGASNYQLTGGTGAAGVSNYQQLTGNTGGNYQLSAAPRNSPAMIDR